MLSIHGIYDGKSLKLFKEVKISSPKKVIVTFLEETYEDLSDNDMLLVAQEGGAFDFLDNDDEDMYTDKDLKTKY